MKILDSGDTPILSSEVYDLLKSDSGNFFAFSTDPLENCEISDPDQLRKLVTVKRVCEYLETCVDINKIDRSEIPAVLQAFESQTSFSIPDIASCVDLAGFLGPIAEPEIASIYLPSSEQADVHQLILEQLRVLTGNSHLNVTPRKRRVPTPRKNEIES